MWATAEDVVSLTFLEAWRLRGTVRPDGDDLSPWLLGIATNVLRNTTRAARRYQATLSRDVTRQDTAIGKAGSVIRTTAVLRRAVVDRVGEEPRGQGE
ncbi:RNA polymerase sigma factor [Streptomyces collinus]|uniref:RNA polymerase sigma factor n=1 Tax=Streptomyces collinus TaxID=42684 RepID=UPI00363823FE